MGVWQADFRKRWNDRSAISIDLSGMTGEFSVTVLFGKSGEGKSTALRCLAGLECPDGGRIEFDGDCWFSESVHKPPQQRGIGFLLQDRALFPHLTVAENVAFGIRNVNRDERERRVRELLRNWGIEPNANQYPSQLSGGEQQRTALARTLAAEPRFLLLDEPLSSLDEPTRERLGSELRKQLAAYAIPVLLVTHRRDEAIALGDRICVMHGGRLVQSDTVRNIFDRPLNADVAEILGWTIFPAAEVVNRHGDRTTLQIGETTFSVSGKESPGNSTRWGIRAHDVSLLSSGQSASENQNQLSVRVTGIRQDERGLRVEVDLGSGFEIVVPRGHDASGVFPGEKVVIGFHPDSARLFS